MFAGYSGGHPTSSYFGQKSYRLVADNHQSVDMDMDSEDSEDKLNESSSPLGFDDDLDDADVEELMLRKQLLLSALNQCDDEDSELNGVSGNLGKSIVPKEEEDEEENTLRAALLCSLRSDADEGNSRSSHAIETIDSELRAAILSSDNNVPSKPTVIEELNTATNTSFMLYNANVQSVDTYGKRVVRSTKIGMSINELASLTNIAPRVNPVIIPLNCSDDSESDEETESKDKNLELIPCKKQKMSVKPPAKPLENGKPLPSSKDLFAVKRILAVKQADVARAEQLVDHLKQKLKNAELILDLSRKSLGQCKQKEMEIYDNLQKTNNLQPSNGVSSSHVTSLRQPLSVQVLSDNSVKSIPSRSSNSTNVSPRQKIVFYSHGTWLSIDEFFPALHLSTIASLKKIDLSHDDKHSRASDDKPSISLRWLLLTNEKAPSADFLRTLLYTNFSHAITCPYQLTGECKDKNCPYEHLIMGTDWILIRLASLCPQALGLNETDLSDKKAVKARIESVLAKFHGNDKNEGQLIQFVWQLVRTALVAEIERSSKKTRVDLSSRISYLTNSGVNEEVSVLSDQDVNRAVSAISESIPSDKRFSKMTASKHSVQSRLKTLCQILKCRSDFSYQMAVQACLAEFVSVNELLEAVDFLMANPTILLPTLGSPSKAGDPKLISTIVLSFSLFKLCLLLTTSHQNVSISLEKILGVGEKENDAKERLEFISKTFVVEDYIYLQMVLIHALCFQSMPSDFVANVIGKRSRTLFSTNFWHEKSLIFDQQVNSQIEKLLTACVSSCQNLQRQLHGIFTTEQSQLVYSVLAQAVNYRLWKASKDSGEAKDKIRKVCEKFYSKLCGDFPKFSAPLTLLIARQFCHFLSSSFAVDFLANSSVIPNHIRLLPSVIYGDFLIRLIAEPEGEIQLPTREEIVMISRQFEPDDGCGIIGVGEHFFSNVLRVFCQPEGTEPGSSQSLSLYHVFRGYTKSIFCSNLSQKLIVTMSFAVRCGVRGQLHKFHEDPIFCNQLVAPYFSPKQPIFSASKQRIQLLAHLLQVQLRLDPSSDNEVDALRFELVEKALDDSCLSNDLFLNMVIDQTLESPTTPDLTYLAGVACRLSCELRKGTPGFHVTLPCMNSIVRLISTLESPNALNSTPQTRAVLIHSAFRLASSYLAHHPYDIRLWKSLFTCQRSLSAKLDPTRTYCQFLIHLGMKVPV